MACIRAVVRTSLMCAGSNFVYLNVIRMVAWPATTLLNISIGTPAMCKLVKVEERMP